MCATSRSAIAVIALIGVIATVASACLGSEVVECGGGGVCPAGLVCRLDRGEQICALATCGNGVMESGESCDDGNNETGDLCPGDCVSLPTCGNGSVEFGEECDDGNLVSSDGCQASCLRPVYPPARWGHAMTYDATRGVMVLFGGIDANMEPLDDTWEWNGAEWIERRPSGAGPSARQLPAMTYDPVRERVLLFGGAGNAGFMDDTWEWDGEVWRERIAAVRPPRSRAFLTFDASGNVAILVNEMDQTWKWDGSGWERPSPSFTPMIPSFALLAYHPGESVPLLVDGMSPATWRWDGTTWTMWPTTPPPLMLGGGIAYDPTRQRMVIVGVRNPDTVTWELDGAVWSERSDVARPPSRGGADVVFHAAVGAIVRFGGYGNDDGLHDDTWAWDGTAWRERL